MADAAGHVDSDGRKAVFYFIAENRIDFRDLVRDSANTCGCASR